MRLLINGYFSATQIVDTGNLVNGQPEYLVIAISLSNKKTGQYHQITTIHPARWKDIFKGDGTLRDKYVRVK